MNPQRLAHLTRREVPLLRADEPVGGAVRKIVDADVPALPVIDRSDKLIGIFGEREFVAAVFPGYLSTLGYAGFVTKAMETDLEKRASCRNEAVGRYTNTEHIAAPMDFSDAQLAETFLHHRVLIIPIVEDDRVIGIVTRNDFFKALVELLEPD
jgi:CBS domain-containing protein